MIRTAVRWWPLIGLVGVVVIGLVVGRGSTALDDWFRRAGAVHPALGRLLILTDGRVVAVVWALTLGVVLLRRRWRLAGVTVVTPVLALVGERVCKRLFGRLSDGALAYPSGHTTFAVVVLGLAVLAVGVTVGAVGVAGVLAVAGMLGQAVTYHYFTDTVGALLLATALLCLMVRATGAAPFHRPSPRATFRSPRRHPHVRDGG